MHGHSWKRSFTPLGQEPTSDMSPLRYLSVGGTSEDLPFRVTKSEVSQGTGSLHCLAVYWCLPSSPSHRSSRPQGSKATTPWRTKSQPDVVKVCSYFAEKDLDEITYKGTFTVAVLSDLRPPITQPSSCVWCGQSGTCSLRNTNCQLSFFQRLYCHPGLVLRERVLAVWA